MATSDEPEAATDTARASVPRPLSGCRVIEAARFVTGPFAGQLLADLGAEVTKIEEPEHGDPFRGWGGNGYGAPFIAFNRNKRSLTLNLKHKDGRQILFDLVKDADVFIQNNRPGVAEKLGIEYETLSAINPRLIYCSITGVGKDGPYAGDPCYDVVGQGLSGLLSLLVNVADPIPVGPTFADSLTGLYAAYGILAALCARQLTGRGQHVETSLLQATMGFMHEPYSSLFQRGRAPDAMSRPRASQVYAFVCSDSLPLAVHISSSEKFWHAFAKASGHPELTADPRLKNHPLRRENWDLVHDTLTPTFRTRRREEWLRILRAADVPVAPIYKLDEAVNDPQVRHLGMVQPIRHPVQGESKVVGFPVTLSDTSLGPIAAPAMLGEHTEEILSAIGRLPGEIEKLRRDGTI